MSECHGTAQYTMLLPFGRDSVETTLLPFGRDTVETTLLPFGRDTVHYLYGVMNSPTSTR